MLDLLSTPFGHMPDARCPDRVHSSLHDTLMSGLAMMGFQHASLLALQRKMQQRRGRCNLETLFGVHEVPSDTPRRAIVDGVPPEVRRPLLPALFAKVRRAGWAPEWQRPVPSGFQQGDYYSVMLDGSDAFHSTAIQCPGCWPRTDANGEGHWRPTVVSATRGKAGSHRVLPLDGAEVRHSDGQDKQDGAVTAATRRLPRLRQDHPQLPLIIGGDELSCHEPFRAQWRALRLHQVLVCQPPSHVALYAWVEDMERLGGCDQGQWPAGPACRRRFYTYRLARAVPLTAARRGGALVEVWEHDRTGQQLYHNAWFTDLEVTPDNVAAIVRIGRSRWKMENEHCKVHKNQSGTARRQPSSREDGAWRRLEGVPKSNATTPLCSWWAAPGQHPTGAFRTAAS